MSDIPEDVYLEILIRVPVKTALVCKCVCRNWLDLISSSHFVNRHLNFNIQMNNYNLILHGADGISKSNYPLQSIRYDSLSEAAWMNEFQDGVVKMDHPFKSAGPRYHVSLRSSCNGLVCLGFSYSLTVFLCLWNPATTEFKILPEQPRENNKESVNLYMIDYCAIYALGYDDEIDDYKLVKLVNMTGGMDTLVSIYTLGSNSWKCIQTIPYRFTFHRGSGEIIKGSLHWLVKSVTKSTTIVSFDISQERFEELQPPLQGGKELFTSIGKWEESLCLLVDAGNSEFDVWVMQEYGVQESWCKLSSITLRFVAKDSFFRLSWPIKDGKILLTYHGDLILYDPKGETYQCLRKLVRNVGNYVESLVSLNSSTYVGR